jgi:hypothetical protein
MRKVKVRVNASGQERIISINAYDLNKSIVTLIGEVDDKGELLKAVVPSTPPQEEQTLEHLVSDVVEDDTLPCCNGVCNDTCKLSDEALAEMSLTEIKAYAKDTLKYDVSDFKSFTNRVQMLKYLKLK